MSQWAYWQSAKCKLKQKVELPFHIFHIDKIKKPDNKF